VQVPSSKSQHAGAHLGIQRVLVEKLVSNVIFAGRESSSVRAWTKPSQEIKENQYFKDWGAGGPSPWAHIFPWIGQTLVQPW